jgi:hypothetical protein|tara:strand:+ start:956 stop:1213 length:258 start_codon:yes stop_codon:yes gene_type:complete
MTTPEEVHCQRAILDYLRHQEREAKDAYDELRAEQRESGNGILAQLKADADELEMYIDQLCKMFARLQIAEAHNIQLREEVEQLR